MGLRVVKDEDGERERNRLTCVRVWGLQNRNAKEKRKCCYDEADASFERERER